MAPEKQSLSTYVMTLLEEGQGREQIETLLLEKGHDEKFVKELVKEARQLWDTKRRSQGLTLILIGAVMCFLSFVLTITSTFSTGSFPYILYGLTSLGIIVVFTGVMKVF